MNKIRYSGNPYRVFIVKTRRCFRLKDGDEIEVTNEEFEELKKINDDFHKFEEITINKRRDE